MNRKADMRLVLVLGLVTLLTLGGFISTGFAQAKCPSRPMTIICPWGAGGGTDAVARIMGALLEKELGQPVNVVNRTGGGGAVGHTAGANAAPDGYTMCLTTVEITMMHWMGMAQVN